MKRSPYLLTPVLACLALLASCAKVDRSPPAVPADKKAMHASFLTQLDVQGYFRGLDSEKSQVLKAAFSQKGWMAIFSDSHRFYHADAEELAEGGLCTFIKSLTPFLEAQGVKLPGLRDDVSETGYVVWVGGVPSVIYDAGEIKRDVEGTAGGLTWALAMTRGFAIVDRLLESAGSPERLYAINGGNDLFALFLTPEMHRIISAQPDANPKEGPYKPTEEHPWFGQVHE